MKSKAKSVFEDGSRQREEAEERAILSRNPPPHVGGYRPSCNFQRRGQSCTFFECVLAKKVRTDPALARRACLKNGSRRGNEADGCSRSPRNPPRYLGGYAAWEFFRQAFHLAGWEACATPLRLAPVRALPLPSRRATPALITKGNPQIASVSLRIVTNHQFHL